MKKNVINISIVVVIVSAFLILSVIFNFENLRKDVYSYSKGVVTFKELNYHKLYNDDFSYLNIDTRNYDNIAFLNKNNYFKNNIKVYDIDKGKLIYIDPFQKYQNEDEVYAYGGLYINQTFYPEFIDSFDFSKYYKEISKRYGETEMPLNKKESKVIKDIIKGEGVDKRLYNGIKQDLSEFSYEIDLKSDKYRDIYIKVRVYRTKNNDLVIKFKDKIYYANELKENEDINKNTAYYTYKGDDYGYLYNTINTNEDLVRFAFHDFILSEMPKESYKNYVKDVFGIIDNEKFDLKDKVLFLKQLLYSKYKPTLREDFPLRIERIKNLNIINDNRKTYRIDHDFLFKIFNYPANLYSLAFYEDDLLYNIPERYKDVYENYVNTIINDDKLDYLKKNDMIVAIQNEFVVVDEDQLKKMREKYGKIDVIEESNTRIKYAPAYYGFLYDQLKDEEDLKKFAFSNEVIDNIFTDYFKEKYKDVVTQIINSDKIDFNTKIKEVMKAQLKFSLIKIEKEDYYREKYKDNYYNESYISKVRSIIEK